MPALIEELSQGPGRLRRRLLTAGGLALGIGVAVAFGGPAPRSPTPAPAVRRVWSASGTMTCARPANRRPARAARPLPPTRGRAPPERSTIMRRAGSPGMAMRASLIIAASSRTRSSICGCAAFKQRRDELSDASALLQEPDPKTVERGPQIAGALGELATCATARRSPPPSPPRQSRGRAPGRGPAPHPHPYARARDRLASRTPWRSRSRPWSTPGLSSTRPRSPRLEFRVGRLLNRTGKFAESRGAPRGRVLLRPGRASRRGRWRRGGPSGPAAR